MKQPKRALAVFVSSSLALASAVGGCATEAVQPEAQPVSAPQTIGASAPVTQQSANTLDQLVAPVALYPDALVAQVLAAATFPAEVVEADRWMQEHEDLKGRCTCARSRFAVLGSQRKGAHAVSLGARDDGQELVMDVGAR